MIVILGNTRDTSFPIREGKSAQGRFNPFFGSILGDIFGSQISPSIATETTQSGLLNIAEFLDVEIV